MKIPPLPLLLSFNAGFVDTAGFLALQGLFTAHVTGNFVTLGAALVLGTSGIVAKLIALPVFILFAGVSRLIGILVAARGGKPLAPLLTIQSIFLFAVFGLAVWLGPFTNGDTAPAILTGMTAVAAMSIQNVVQRLHLGAAPPTTLMTGNTTQLVIDFVDLALQIEPSQAAARARMGRMAAGIGAFAAGCALGALLIAKIHMWCFAMPPLVAVLTLFAERAAMQGQPDAAGGGKALAGKGG